MLADLQVDPKVTLRDYPTGQVTCKLADASTRRETQTVALNAPQLRPSLQTFRRAEPTVLVRRTPAGKRQAPRPFRCGGRHRRRCIRFLCSADNGRGRQACFLAEILSIAGRTDHTVDFQVQFVPEPAALILRGELQKKCELQM